MAFVKLDCGILDSTLWVDREARELFVTALLMAEPFELREKASQISIKSLDETGFIVPVGWYGRVEAAGIGIVRRAGMEVEAGLAALERLGNPEMESRTPDFGGRRMVRVAGGFIILNFSKYREKDHTAAERSKRYRDKKMGKKKGGKGAAKAYEPMAIKAHADGDEKAFDAAVTASLPPSMQ